MIYIIICKKSFARWTLTDLNLNAVCCNYTLQILAKLCCILSFEIEPYTQVGMSTGFSPVKCEVISKAQLNIWLKANWSMLPLKLYRVRSGLVGFSVWV